MKKYIQEQKQIMENKNIYLTYLALQILLTSFLVLYVSLDLRKNFKKPVVKIAENFIALIMALDILIRLRRNKTSIWKNRGLVIDLVILVLYAFTMIIMIDHGIDMEDEFFEFLLIFVRYLLQIARIIIYIDRTKKNLKEYAQSDTLYLEDISIENMNISKTGSSSGSFDRDREGNEASELAAFV